MPTLPEGSVVVDHVWKRFRADEPLPEFKEQVLHAGRRLRGRRSEWTWVLKDVNLEVRPGETVALVGVNGSGKSTLLKVISQVTYQSAGRCQVAGRIGALLEVRSGIHPDLNGRENVFLYGTILGMSRRQIAARLDEIVDFAEVAEAVDRPVKFYSSGMQVRLGFAIAAFLDPAVLLVDEALSVGDASFQQKCLQRISDVVAGGTTLLFVSHDLASVEAMCDRAVWLADAVVRAQGPTREVLSLYRSSVEERAALATDETADATVVKTAVHGDDGGQVLSGGELHLRLVVRASEAGNAAFVVGVSEGTAMPIFVNRRAISFPAGEFEVRCTLRHLPLPHGRFSLWAGMIGRTPERRVRSWLPWQPVAAFDVFGPTRAKPPKGVMVLSPVHVDATWDVG